MFVHFDLLRFHLCIFLVLNHSLIDLYKKWLISVEFFIFFASLRLFKVIHVSYCVLMHYHALWVDKLRLWSTALGSFIIYDRTVFEGRKISLAAGHLSFHIGIWIGAKRASTTNCWVGNWKLCSLFWVVFIFLRVLIDRRYVYFFIETVEVTDLNSRSFLWNRW